MKKWGFLAAIMLLCQSLAAQFELTPQGFVDSRNGQNRYVVYEFSGRTQQELFDICRINIETARQTATELFYSSESPDSITITQYVPNVIWNARQLGQDYLMDINFSVTFRFREGRIRADSPVILAMIYRRPVEKNGMRVDERDYYWLTQQDYKNANLGGKYIYDRNGVIKSAGTKVKESLEDFMNRYISDMIRHAPEQAKPEDW